ncbi:MAG TPA: hypothetical protein VIG79_18600 [Lapillicoccus sp.]
MVYRFTSAALTADTWNDLGRAGFREVDRRSPTRVVLRRTLPPRTLA